MNINTAHTLAVASKLVYQDESEAENAAYGIGLPEFEWFEVEDTQAAVMANDDHCILAFRGTTDLGDWMTNLDVWKTAYKYGEVHSGFHAALELVWDDIEPVLAQYSDRQLYITGHSLGGALATLALAELGYGDLYTFGSPRVGDEDFARTFKSLYRTYRFVNNNDVVTRIPLSGYEHIGSLRHFTTSGKMLIEPGNWRVELDRIWGRMGWTPMDGIKDHNMANYIRLIEKQDVNASWSGVSF